VALLPGLCRREGVILSTHLHVVVTTVDNGCSCNIRLNPLNVELNPICHLLALLEAHHIFHVTGLRVNGVHREKFDLFKANVISRPRKKFN
jgi:hypothetical protein